MLADLARELDRLMHARARAKSFGNPTLSTPQEFERVGRLIATIKGIMQKTSRRRFPL